MNQLKVDLKQAITALAGKGWSKRRVARELDLDRSSVRRYWPTSDSKQIKTFCDTGAWGGAAKSRVELNLAGEVQSVLWRLDLTLGWRDRRNVDVEMDPGVVLRPARRAKSSCGKLLRSDFGGSRQREWSSFGQGSKSGAKVGDDMARATLWRKFSLRAEDLQDDQTPDVAMGTERRRIDFDAGA